MHAIWFWIFIFYFFKVSSSKSIDNTTANDQLLAAIFQTLENENSNHSFEESNSTLRMATYCITPNGDNGFCVPIKNCSKLMSQLKNPNAKIFLRESKCGPKRDSLSNPKVCCGKYGTYKYAENFWPSSCGYQNVTIKGRILGGKEAVLGEFPWLARLYHKNKKNTKVFGCSGSLITSRFVLTAAHCLLSENTQILGPIYEVRLGEHNTKTKIDCTTNNRTCAPRLETFRIRKTFIHPSYDNTSVHNHHDIGLILLKKKVTFSPYILPICIPAEKKFEPFEYWLSGWGRTESSELSHIKMKLSVPPFSHSNCTKLYQAEHIKIINKQLCAGGKKNKDSCTGDSGGPLMFVKDRCWFAAGVVSYGYGCGVEGWPGVYTNVTSYYSWIEKTVRNNSKVKTTTQT